MKLIVTILSPLLLACCSPSQSKEAKIPVAAAVADTSHEATAVFAEGCFWHTEIVFQSLLGVRDAVSGYAGGNTVSPTYEDVSDGTTGYAEAVQVHYDPSTISYETLVKAFFASHDPTTLNRQGNDAGTQYRSVAFYSTIAEKNIIEAEIKKITAEKKYSDKIVTEVLPLTKFYPAEDYHQEYISLHPENPYVQHVSIPDFQEFRKTFKEGKFKE